MTCGRGRYRIAPAALGLLLLVLAGGASSTSSSRPKIGLALSGGGARGIAHVAILRYLEEKCVPIDYIAGTSMGAIVGGLYASGLSPDQIEKAVMDIDWSDLFNDWPPGRDLVYRRKEDDSSDLIKIEMGIKNGRILLPRGLVSGQKIAFAIESMTLHAAMVRDFNQLPIPFRAVATDLGSGEMVVLDHGHLADALRASMAIPGAVAPLEMEGRLLADGGLVRNLPVDVVRQMGADVVIAVDVSTPLLKPEKLRSLPDITTQVSGLMTHENVMQQIKDADIAIVPELGEIGAGSFYQAPRILEIGRQAALVMDRDLERLSLPPEEYQLCQDKLHEPLPGPPTIDTVEIEGAARVDRRILERRMHTRAGEPLHLGTLKRDLARIYELGDFERVDYALEPDVNRTKLIIRAHEKSWGPNFFRLGLNVRNDFEGSTDFTVLSRLTMTRLNRLGAEWRSDVEVGESRRVSTEFYQPIDFTGTFFVVPSVDHGNALIEAFDEDDQRIAEFQTRSTSGSLAVGAQLGRYGEVRGGLVLGRVRARLNIGDLPLPLRSVSTAAYAGRLSIDRLDDSNFPHMGRRGLIDVYMARHSLGSDVSYDRVQGAFVQILGRHRHQVFFGLDGGTNLGSHLPFYDEFNIGGLFSLSGFKDGQLSGQMYGVARLGWYRRSGRLSNLIGRGIYLGGWVEGGNVWLTTDEIDLQDLRYTGTVTLGVDTLIGPLFLAYGHADGGHDALYLSIGRSLGGRRRFGLGH